MDGAPRLNVGVIGVGRAGAVLGAAMARAGHPVVGVYGVSDLSRLRGQALLPTVPFLEPTTIAEQADLLWLTVPDDALAGMVSGLVAANCIRPGTFIAHASGRHGIDILRPLVNIGGLPLALHPVMTFTGTSIDLARLDGCPFGVTTVDELRPAAEAMVVEMGGEPVWVPEESRAIYHAAIAGGANHMITLVSQTLELLTLSGIETPQRLVAPLLGASVDNALRLGDQALTGPVARGDAETVKVHLDEIGRRSLPAQRAYRELARLTADRALNAGILAPTDAERLLEVLS